MLSRLPGVGGRSARRMALQLLKQKETLMIPLAEQMLRTAQAIKECEVCGNLDTASPCHICTDGKRDPALLCVVEDIADVWAMERGRIFSGGYHVLGGTLSAIDGRGPQDLRIDSLLQRVSEGVIQEIILATNTTVEGQTTAHYLTERLNGFPVKLSRLAQGIPLGGELDYLDEGTLGAAIRLRQSF